MRFYKIEVPGEPFSYVCTLAHVREVIAELSTTLRAATFIDLVEIKADHSTVASILSGNGCAETSLRTWSVTPRGGLKETTKP